MTDAPDSTPAPDEVKREAARILIALRRAVQEALLRHKQAGNPVPVWRNGRVEWVAPADIPAPEPTPPADAE